MSSGAALGLGTHPEVHYGTAKAGILGFTRCLARELGTYGITVNAVMPAAATRMTQMVLAPAKLARLQTPEDVAPLVVYLASDRAASINGATFAAHINRVIQLISDPSPVNGIYKEQGWTVADLATVIPKTLARGL
jgi:NAD(P)-dependent dehydrogenase (short-subunit alcohol dehydrogenase family)